MNQNSTDMKPEEMFKEVDLCQELVPYVTTCNGIPFIHHPLLVYSMYTKEMNNWINHHFAYKKESLEKHRKQKDLGGIVFTHERPYRIDAFNDAVIQFGDSISDEEYFNVLREMWVDSENIWQNLEEWKQLFKDRRRKKRLFMTENDREVFDAMPEVITIWRGYKPDEVQDYSYTTDEKVAEMFAKRWAKKNQKCIVGTYKVLKSKVIAYTNARSEKEIIIFDTMHPVKKRLVKTD